MNSWKAKFGLPFVDDLPLREYILYLKIDFLMVLVNNHYFSFG